MRRHLVRFGFRALVVAGILTSLSSGAVFGYLPFNGGTIALGLVIYFGGFGLFMWGLHHG